MVKQTAKNDFDRVVTIMRSLKRFYGITDNQIGNLSVIST